MKANIVVGITDALIIGDIQVDFLPGGALPVPESDQIIPIINDYVNIFRKKGMVFAVRDWHPPDQMSFKERGGPWSPHCVQESEGAKFHRDFHLPPNALIISKGTNRNLESYSAFSGTDLAAQLRSKEISRLCVCGVATDYCIINTVLDAISQGFEVYLLVDAIKGINVEPEDSALAIEKMTTKGTEIVTLKDFEDPISDIPVQESADVTIEGKPLNRAIMKKKARLRSRGPYRKAKTER